MKPTLIVALLLALLVGCSDRNNSGSQETTAHLPIDTTKSVNNLISIVEIPVDSFQRATRFYESILNVTLQPIDMQGTKMGLFPGDAGTVNVALVSGEGYKPSDQGTLAYLNGGEDLQVLLDKIVANGGKVVIPKTAIDAENGFFATFIDSEGNKLGLHSLK